MALELTILYRGPVASCNYSCGYCPFAHVSDSEEVIANDQHSLARFTRWVATSPYQLSVFFAPKGEVLTHEWYRNAICKLSRLDNIDRVAVQTNLACHPKWLENCDLAKIGLWCTYHPSQVASSAFLQHCTELSTLGVRFSVGGVGMIESIPKFEHLRTNLPPDVYLWINAYKHESGYYSTEHIRRLESIDPLFRLNMQHYHSAGRICRTGKSVISVFGDGTVQRCFFVKTPLGNIYESDIKALLRTPPCTAETCHCHIGYIYLPELGLDSVFNNGMLERIPFEPIWRDSLAAEKARSLVQATLTKEGTKPKESQARV